MTHSPKERDGDRNPGSEIGQNRPFSSAFEGRSVLYTRRMPAFESAPEALPDRTAGAAPPDAAAPSGSAPIRRGDTLEIEVLDLAFGGRALARIDGFVVFVENALPGDRVTATVYRKHRRYAEARALRVLRPAATRVEPRCEHVPVCGGCRTQDLAYEEQIRHKERQVEAALEHLGGLRVPLRPTIPAPRLFHYRNKMEYSFAQDASGRLALGLHVRGFFDRTFDLMRCHIATPVSSRIVAFVRDAARREGLTAYDTRRHEGLLRYLAIREGIRTGEVMVNFVATEPHPFFERIAPAIVRAFPRVRSVLLNLTRRRAQVATGEEERILAGSPTILETLGGLTFEISSSSFFQTNTEQAERLLEVAIEGLGLTGAERVLDVYSGTGTFTLPIAKHAREAIGIESSDVAVRDAERNAKRNGIANARFWTGEAMEILRDRFGLGTPQGGGRGTSRAPAPGGSMRPGTGVLRADAGGGALHDIDAVLVDPPRAGLHPGVVSRLIHLGAPRLVYVSCNPSTLGRDLALLCERRYRPLWVRAVDMFPHTSHIECVAVLERTPSASPQESIP
ncbi:MAG TPA: 23S rRNA (uracil(1939)-C(5))-methyltransferase RlmD [Candidatus Eisenbacteria bacterium]|nr:23S rRNA (uracil(1939)-C(5))-methyltransferase RlmD [Candidatus Eisenbacteria bacterium]